jgi:hypothetical protein
LERSVDDLELEIKALENLREESTGKSHNLQARHDLMLGVILGVLYGIIGGFFVQFIYPVIQGLVSNKYDLMFWPNVLLSIITFAMIVGTTITYKRQLGKTKQGAVAANQNAKRYDSAIQKRKHELEELKKVLEELRESQKKIGLARLGQ